MPTPKIVTVTITLSPPATPPGPASILIAVDQDPVKLQDHGHGAGAHIHWDISTPGWMFDTAGVAVHNHGTKFSDKGQAPNKRRHTWQRDDPPDGAKYKYAISVTDGTATATWDPWIIND